MIIKLDKEKWNNWFAGLTDGDGTFYINKKEKTVSFELTTSLADIRIGQILKNEFKGGSIKLRSNAKAFRYRVKKKEILLDILDRLHGKLHNPVRIEQYEKVCDLLKVPKSISPSNVEVDSPYLSGLLDSDGTISISVGQATAEDSQICGNFGKILRLVKSRGHGQIYVRITSIYKEAVQLLIDSYGFGTIFVEEPPEKKPTWKTKYHWTIRSKEEFIELYNLLKKYPLRSVKMHRVRLSLLYFKYKELKYHLKNPETIEFKIWQKFCKSWFKYSE